MFNDLQITFIGSGTMSEVMIRGLLSQKVVRANQIVASDPLESRRTQMQNMYSVHITSDNIEAVQGASIVVLSVKPQVLGRVSSVLKSQIHPTALVLSIVAGASISFLRQGLNHAGIVRAMPNIPAQVGMAATVWIATPEVTDEQRLLVKAILQSLGEEIAVQSENYINMATGLSGAGPGFVFLFLEAMIDAGVQMGFSRAEAQKLTLQTIAGSVELMRQSSEHPAVLRSKVTSPGGATAAGIYELERRGMRTAICDAVYAAFQRTQELGELIACHNLQQLSGN